MMHFHTATEAARIGGFSKDSIILRVYEGEGPIPHFHFDNDEKNIHGCIRLDCAKYFSHGNKQSTLNSEQRKELVNYLTARSDEEGFTGTVWRLIVFMWNLSNPHYRISADIMPNYLNLH